MKKNKKLVLMALFIAISYIGALVKVPGPMSTIALDSFPGYLGGLIFGGVSGGLIAMIAHIFVSMTTGFPLSILVHVIISLMMFVSVFCYAKISKKFNIILASIAASIINGVLMPLSLMLLPSMDKGFLLSLIPVLLIASITNIVLSNVLYASIKNVLPAALDE